uniref:protein-serine/threonine phosphatase n=1 Tax=viral metagenome TaxID=1070528 RepID=A0A6C0L2H0_9ZZZZ|tara:strand:- start:2096 stop:3028 length:933 start_codon:yes stop_codon:yes gene_type:complete
MGNSREDLLIIHNYIKNVILKSLLNSKTDKLPISMKALFWLIRQAKVVFENDEMLISINPPVNICGDIHGQFPDLLSIFNKLGYPSRNNRFLFLGDYVDRGKQSIEVICLLFCYKIMFHRDVFLLRGNHETADVSRMYGFYDECKRRGSIKLWKCFVDTFNVMPVAATVGLPNLDPLMLCMHGGISPHLTDYNDIKNIKRPTDIPDSGILCDLLWADPETDGPQFLKGWHPNDRGVSYVFCRDVLSQFLKTNGLELIVRGHQVVEDGYEFYGNRQLVTIFSAPRYCGEFDNKAGIMTVFENLKCTFTIFD